MHACLSVATMGDLAIPTSSETQPDLTLGALAEHAGAELRGEADFAIQSVRSLEQAGERDLSFALSDAYRSRAVASGAGALLVPPSLGDLECPLLVAREPKLALARILAQLERKPRPAPGAHPTAVVDAECEVDPTASIGPFAVVGAGADVAAGAVVHAHVVIGRDCVIGEGAELHPHVVLYDGTRIGARTIVHAGTVLGGDGFGYAHTAQGHVKLPHLGRTVVGDDVEIGALSAVDRGLTETTAVGSGTKIDNLVQVGHNVTIGRGCIICGQAGLAGTATLEDFVVMGGQSGAGDHVRLGKGAQVAARSAVLQSIDDGAVVGGVPAIALGTWRRQVAALGRLRDWARRLRKVEKALESRQHDPEADPER